MLVAEVTLIMPRSKTLLISSLILLVFSILILRCTMNAEKIFYDFRLYYFAVEAYEEGLDYYEPLTKQRIEELHLAKEDFEIASKVNSLQLTYVYPPLTIKLFQLFYTGNYNTSIFLFTLFKLIVLALVFWVWYKTIIIDNYLFFTIFVLFAFDATLYHDFNFGQVTIIEQLFLWIGIYAFLKRNYLLFCGSIIIASCFKLTPILFLILLFFSPDKKKYLYFLGANTCFILYLGFNYLFDPVMFGEFVKTFAVHFDGNRIDGRSVYHPSLYMLIDSFYYNLSTKGIGLTYKSVLTICTFGIISVIIAVLSFSGLKKLYTKHDNKDLETDKLIIFLVCIVYALLNPKFMCYSYILLLLPTYYIIQRTTAVRPYYLFLFILLLSPRYSIYGVEFINKLYWSFFQVFLTIGIWYIYLYEIIWKEKNFTRITN
jgi:hypothetical protein